MSQINVEVALFGAFRRYGNTPVALTVAAGTPVAEVKRQFGAALAAGKDAATAEAITALLASSALADDRQVFTDDALINQGGSLAILPPVCGG
jgi:molybdopterin converting factor small subunit